MHVYSPENDKLCTTQTKSYNKQEHASKVLKRIANCIKHNSSNGVLRKKSVENVLVKNGVALRADSYSKCCLPGPDVQCDRLYNTP